MLEIKNLLHIIFPPEMKFYYQDNILFPKKNMTSFKSLSILYWISIPWIVLAVSKCSLEGSRRSDHHDDTVMTGSGHGFADQVAHYEHDQNHSNDIFTRYLQADSPSARPTETISISPTSSQSPTSSVSPVPVDSIPPSLSPYPTPSYSPLPIISPAPSQSSLPTDSFSPFPVTSSTPTISSYPTSSYSIYPVTNSLPSRHPITSPNSNPTSRSSSPTTTVRPIDKPSTYPTTTNTEPTLKPSSVSTPFRSPYPSTLLSSIPSVIPSMTASPTKTMKQYPSASPSSATEPTANPSISPSKTVTLSPTRMPIRQPVNPPIPPTRPPCFSRFNVVQVKDDGEILMNQLRIGDYIKAGNGKEYTQVYGFGHYDESAPVDFLRIEFFPDEDISKNNTISIPLEITSSHLVFVKRNDKQNNSQLMTIPASNIVVGDTLSGRKVKSILPLLRYGVYSPLTQSGDMMVSGIHVSNYVDIITNNNINDWNQHVLGHAMFFPQRLYCSMYINRCQNEKYIQGYGILAYVIVRIGSMINECGWFANIIVLLVVVPICMMTYTLEFLLSMGLFYLVLSIIAIGLFMKMIRGGGMKQ
jgi:Hint module